MISRADFCYLFLPADWSERGGIFLVLYVVRGFEKGGIIFLHLIFCDGLKSEYFFAFLLCVGLKKGGDLWWFKNSALFFWYFPVWQFEKWNLFFVLFGDWTFQYGVR